jgi:hypothetical protein
VAVAADSAGGGGSGINFFGLRSMIPQRRVRDRQLEQHGQRKQDREDL